MQRLNAAIAAAAVANPQPFGSVRVGEYHCAFEAQQYARGYDVQLALQLHVMEDGKPVEPFGSVTSCVPDAKLNGDEIIVKSYFENEILREPLLATGYFEDTGRRLPVAVSGALEIWRLTPAFVTAFAAATPFERPASTAA